MQCVISWWIILLLMQEKGEVHIKESNQLFGYYFGL